MMNVDNKIKTTISDKNFTKTITTIMNSTAKTIKEYGEAIKQSLRLYHYTISSDRAANYGRLIFSGLSFGLILVLYLRWEWEINIHWSFQIIIPIVIAVIIFSFCIWWDNR